jgi:hypothetical protein
MADITLSGPVREPECTDPLNVKPRLANLELRPGLFWIPDNKGLEQNTEKH